MKIKVLGILTIVSALAASNVMAADFKHHQYSDNKRQDVRVVVKKYPVIKKSHSNKQHSKKVIHHSKKSSHHSKKAIQRKSDHNHNHNRNDRIGMLVGGLVVASLLSGH